MNTSATEVASHPTPGLTPEALATLLRRDHLCSGPSPGHALHSELILPEDRRLREGLDQRPAGAATVNEFRIRRPDGALR